MIATFVHVQVKQDHIDNFIRASLENHRHSVQEPGNLRFDVVQHGEDPTRFVLYEAYESDEAAAAHKETAHYKAWRDTVADWMDGPRRGVKHIILAPARKSE
jgi:autoinducer 2-degrading protein